MNLRQCNIGRLEETALAVSDLESPLYGHHLKAAEVCDIVSCPDRAEAVRGVLEWVLGPTMAGEALEWEEGEWLWLVAMDANGDVTDVMDDVLVKVRVGVGVRFRIGDAVCVLCRWAQLL